MQLDVLGSSGSHTGPGTVCSGYLLRTPSTTLLVEAGNGSTARLQALVGLEELDAVIISHRHVDHCADLVGIHYALRSAGLGPIPLYAPEGVADALARVAGREAPWVFNDSFPITEIAAGDRLRLGDVGVTVHHSVHTVPAVSLRFEHEGVSLVYSGDTAGGDELVAAARDADVFLCEATWRGDADEHPPGIHLTARDAGRHATSAGVGRLLLTHVAGGVGRDASVREARETFAGDVVAVEDGEQYVIERDPPAA